MASSFWGSDVPKLKLSQRGAPAAAPRPWDLPDLETAAAQLVDESAQLAQQALARAPSSPLGLSLLLESTRQPKGGAGSAPQSPLGGAGATTTLVLPKIPLSPSFEGARRSQLQAALTPSPPPSIRVRLTAEPFPQQQQQQQQQQAAASPQGTARTALRRAPSGFFASHVLTAGELPMPVDQRGPTPREALSESKRLAGIEEGAVRRGALHLLQAVGGGGATGSVTEALGAGAGGDLSAQVAALQSALQLLRPGDLDTAAEYEAWLKDRVLMVVAERRRGGRQGAGGGGGGGDAPSPRFSSSASHSARSAFGVGGDEGAALEAAGGSAEASALAAMDLQASMDTFLSRFVYGVQRGILGMSGGLPPPALRSASPSKAGGGEAQGAPPPPAAAAGRAAAPAAAAAAGAKAAAWGPNPTVLPPFLGQEEMEAWEQAMQATMSSDRVSDGGVYSRAIEAEGELGGGEGGGSLQLLLGQLFLRHFVVVHCRGAMAPIGGGGSGSGASSPGAGSASPAEAGRSGSSSSGGSGGGGSPRSPSPSFRKAAPTLSSAPPKLIPAALSPRLGALLVERMGLPPRSAALLQFALALRGRLDDVRLALCSRSPRAMRALRLPPDVAASLGEAELAGNAKEVAAAAGAMQRVMARRASLTELQRNSAIAMGVAKGYAKYARVVPGQRVDPRTFVLQGDTEGPPMTDSQLEAVLAAVEGAVAQREAAFAQGVEAAWGRLRAAPSVEDLQAEARAALEEHIEAQHKRRELEEHQEALRKKAEASRL